MAVRTPPAVARHRALLDLDADLAEAVAPEQRAYARRALTVPVMRLERGPCELGGQQPPGAFAVMLTSGLAVRDVLLGAAPASELLGPGDIVEAGPVPERMLPALVRFNVAEPVTAAVLDERIFTAIRAWPGLGMVLIARLARQEARQATHRAIAQLPRVDQRVLALLWHLAERWGRVTAAGVTVPLTLTHETIGRLVGARRPTVSLALKELACAGAVTRRADGAWLLDRASAQTLACSAPDGVRPPDVAMLPDLPVIPRQVPVVPAPPDFERLRMRVTMSRQLTAARRERTRGILEQCEATRADVLRARARRAETAAALSRPR